MFSPAAGVEVSYQRKTRARIHVDPHEFLEGFVLLRFVDNGVNITLTLSAGDADRLAGNITQAAAANRVNPVKAVGE